MATEATTTATYDHVTDDITRLVCEGQSTAPDHIEHCLKQMRWGLIEDYANDDVPSAVWNARADECTSAHHEWTDSHDTDETVSAIQRYWLV